MNFQDQQIPPLAAATTRSLDYPAGATISDIFQAQVERCPGAVAIIFGNEKLTYRELNDRANRLAYRLQAQGVRPEVLVGICARRSTELIVGLLAILKAGGAYVPLDPAYPPERLSLILKDIKTPILLTEERLVENLSFQRTPLLILDRSVHNSADNQPPSNPTPES